MKKLKRLAFSYHRNGVGGDGFYCAIGEDKEEKATMLLVTFPGLGQCATAVFDLAKLAKGDIAFGSNSWRGDRFHEQMLHWIEQGEPLDAVGEFPAAISAAVFGGLGTKKKG